MKEITTTKVVTIGYEAFDGTRFSTEDECRKYEKSAEVVIRRNAEDLMVGKMVSVESLYECFCCDDMICVWDIDTADHLRIVNQYLDTIDYGTRVDPKYLGERVAVVVGAYDGWAGVLGTEEELREKFNARLAGVFHPETDTTT
jgi:hypothetical protein